MSNFIFYSVLFNLKRIITTTKFKAYDRAILKYQHGDISMSTQFNILTLYDKLY